jgi:predicted ATP-grasp superfamily ATP-dependent carboligase
MKVLLAEYSVFHDPQLAPEGEAMLRTLTRSFENCGYIVITPQGRDFASELESLAQECDLGLVIAPDHLMAKFTKIIEDNTRNIGCGSLNCALCANKQRSARILSANGIAVPEERTDGTKVIKEICGCGTLNMRLSEDAPGEGEFGQRYIEGDHMSVSLVGSRITGEACLYYSGAEPLVLSLNRQFIDICNGTFTYEGGETPATHPRSDEIIATTKRAADVLGCQGYIGVDVIVGDQIYVVDVNPRITSSINGIAVLMQEEIAEILVRASYGDIQKAVHLTGHVQFDKSGKVTLI